MLSDGEPTRLLEAWTGATVAIVVDAVAGLPPGALRKLVFGQDARGASEPVAAAIGSLAEAIVTDVNGART